MKKMTRLFYCLFGILFITAALQAQTMDSAAVQPFNSGLDKMQKNDYAGALTDFQKALSVSKDYRIYYQLGVAHEKLNNNEEAVNDFKNTIKAKPDFEAAYSDLGSVYFSLNKYQDAIDNFQEVVKITKDSTLKANMEYNMTLAYTSMATAAEKTKSYKKAIEYLKKAVALTNNDAAYLYMAKDFFLMNQYDKAIDAAQNAIKYKKTISEGGPNYYIGVAYQKKNDTKKAKEYLEKAKDDAVYGKYADQVLKAMEGAK